MNKEIEVKAKYSDKEKLIKRITELGGIKQSVICLHDVYFGAPGTDMSNSNALTRVRMKNSEYELTYKGKCKSTGDVWERVELNVKITDGTVMQQILHNLGLEKISENESNREAWTLMGCELLFIDYIKPNKISMLEIEGPSEKDVNAVLDKLGNLVETIGEEAFKKFDESRKKA